MSAKPRRWWPVVKALLGLAILGAVGWRFGQDLGRPELYEHAVRWPWLVLAAGLYLVGMALSAVYWHRLMGHLGASPGFAASMRAYFIATLGKYVPGKAMALVMRIGMMRAEGVPASLAGVTTFCEVLTTMAAGATLAAVLFVFFGPVAPAGNLWDTIVGLVHLNLSPDHPVDRSALVVVCLGLAGITLGPIFPPLVNRVAGRLPLARLDPVPKLRTTWLLEGLAQIMPAWVLMGVGLACAFQAIPGAELPWTLPLLGRLTAIMGLSYVAAFLLWTPGGLGVREFLLGLLLAPELAGRGDEEWVAGRVVLAVLLLRVAWTVAELLAAGALYWVPHKLPSPPVLRGRGVGGEGVGSGPEGGGGPPRPPPPPPRRGARRAPRGGGGGGGGRPGQGRKTPSPLTPLPRVRGRGGPLRRKFVFTPTVRLRQRNGSEPMISVVIPVYNEKESLLPLHAEIVSVVHQSGLALEVVFIDDGSKDGSWDVICDLARRYDWVRGVKFRRNFGKAAALSAGFEAARGDVVLTLDADLQDDPAEIPRFLAALEQGGGNAGRLDVVSGWKRVRRDPWHKVWPSRVFNKMVSSLTGVRLHDHNCGMKAYRAEIFREIRLYGELHRFVPVLAAARGFRVGEIEINHRPRRYGESKYGVRRFVKGFLDLLTVKFLTGFGQRPQHVLGSLGLLSFFLGGAGLLYLALTWVWRLYDPLQFPPLHQRPLVAYSLAALLLGSQMMSIGFVAEMITAYLGRKEDSYSVVERTPPPAGEP